MFFLHEMERVVVLHPSYFDKDTHKNVTEKVFRDAEGTINGTYYIVCVVSVIDISEPRVLPGSGFAEFTISFQAVVWRPFKDEVCDGMVSNVVQGGIFVDIGPLTAFVAKSMIPSDIKYDGNATPPQFTDNADQVIEKGTHIRIKLKGIRSEVGNMYAIATIREDYLGPLLAES